MNLQSIDTIIDTLIDYRGKTPKKSDSGIRLVTAKVIKGGFIQNDNFEYITEDTYGDWMTRGFPKLGDILLTTEAPLGEVAQIRSSEKIALAQRVILLRGDPSIINQNYFFHALKSPYIQNQLQSKATGTTVLGISQRNLRKIMIPIPDMIIQYKISAVLGALDDLIDNYIRQIKILEDVARCLYDEWFIHQRYPGNDKTATNQISNGCNQVTLSDLANEIRDSIHPSEIEPDFPYVGLAHIPQQSIVLDQWGKAGDTVSTKLLFKKQDILFAKIRPYLHKVSISPIDGVSSSDTIIIRPKKRIDLGLVLLLVSSKEFVAFADKTSKGTQMPRADWSVLKEYPIIYPPKEVLDAFNKIIDIILDLISNYTFQNKQLKQTRDLLVPKLISGEIDIADVEIQL